MRNLRAEVLALTFLSVSLFPAPSVGQSVFAETWHTIGRIVLPDFVSGTYELRNFISSQPPLPRTREAHLARLNRIWDYAVFIMDGDIETALVIATMATIPYHTFPAYIPIVNWVVTIPVSSESAFMFERRFENLPVLLYPDSRGGGDRDKLPHFFGAAYLEYQGRNPLLTAFAGEFIEVGEKFFKLEGAYDQRDIDVNYRGIEFGGALRSGKNVLPSEYFDDARNGE